MKFLRFWPLLLAVVTLPFTGCTGSGYRPGGVTATVVDLKPAGSTQFEGSGLLTLRYTNENIAPLGFSSSKLKLSLNGTVVGSVVSDQPFGIPPVSSVTQTVTLRLENLPFVRQLVSSPEASAVRYQITGTLYQVIDEEKYDQKVAGEGVIDLHQPAAAAK